MCIEPIVQNRRFHNDLRLIEQQHPRNQSGGATLCTPTERLRTLPWRTGRQRAT
jgi:hypothetical protein